MSHKEDKEKQVQPAQEGIEATSSAEAAPAASEPTGAESAQPAAPSLEELQKQLAEAQAQAAEYKDGWQRTVAEFQNYRRRVENEKNETHQVVLADIIQRYLPILDDLERALATRPPELPWADGIELIYRKWQALLEAEGVQRIPAEGEIFDPRFHEAIAQEAAENCESGRVIEVVRQGYRLGDRVIRPALVKVAQ